MKAGGGGLKEEEVKYHSPGKEIVNGNESPVKMEEVVEEEVEEGEDKIH